MGLYMMFCNNIHNLLSQRILFCSIWSKIVMIYAPALRDKSVLTQVGVDDLAPKFNRYGPDCVRYNLGFVDVWNQWENNKHRYLRYKIEGKLLFGKFVQI